MGVLRNPAFWRIISQQERWNFAVLKNRSKSRFWENSTVFAFCRKLPRESGSLPVRGRTARDLPGTEWPNRNITCPSAYFRGNPSVRTVCRSNQTGESDKRRGHATGGCSYRQTIHQFRWANEKSGSFLNHYSEPISSRTMPKHCQKIAALYLVLVVDERELTTVIYDERAG